jgi:PAS domain S-box-containing protein
VLSKLPFIALDISRAGVVLDASELLLDICGRSPAEVIGAPLDSLFGARSVGVLNNYLSLKTLDTVTANEELEIVSGTNSLTVSARLVGASTKGQHSLHMYAVESVAGRELLAELRSGAELLRGFIETTSQPMWCIEFTEPVNLRESEPEIIRQVFSNECHWSNCNEAMSRFYFLPPGVDINDQPVRTYFPRSPQNETFVRNLIRNNFNVDRSLTIDLRYDGSTMYVENNVRGKIDDGFLMRMWGTLQDLTDFRNERDKLIQSAELVQRILNAVPDAIFVANRSGVITAVNPACERLFNAQASDVLNASLSDFLSMSDADIQRRWTNGESHRWLDVVTLQSGAVMDCDVRVSPLDDDLFSDFVFSIRPVAPLNRGVLQGRRSAAASKRSTDEVR